MTTKIIEQISDKLHQKQAILMEAHKRLCEVCGAGDPAGLVDALYDPTRDFNQALDDLTSFIETLEEAVAMADKEVEEVQR